MKKRPKEVYVKKSKKGTSKKSVKKVAPSSSVETAFYSAVSSVKLAELRKSPVVKKAKSAYRKALQKRVNDWCDTDNKPHFPIYISLKPKRTKFYRYLNKNGRIKIFVFPIRTASFPVTSITIAEPELMNKMLREAYEKHIQAVVHVTPTTDSVKVRGKLKSVPAAVATITSGDLAVQLAGANFEDVVLLRLNGNEDQKAIAIAELKRRLGEITKQEQLISLLVR